MGEAAVAAAKAVNYFNAGTIEFIFDSRPSTFNLQPFYFLEMNTRLQVEHPVTELTTGLDLVQWQIRVAAGERFPYSQEQITQRGHAIECRVYAEDPASGFLPSPGTITNLVTPAGPGVRDDGGAYPGSVISSFYDPLISKLSVWAPTRERAIARMRRALSESVVTGIRTNLAFHEKLFLHPEFVAGRYDTGFLERHKEDLLGYPAVRETDRAKVAAAIAIAASRMEGATKNPGADSGGDHHGALSPWVSTHRARHLT